MSVSTKDIEVLADWLLLQSVNQANTSNERRGFAQSGEWLYYWLESKKLTEDPELKIFVMDCVKQEMQMFVQAM